MLKNLYSCPNFKNKTAVKHIQEIGGLQFLTALKADIKADDLKEKIENLIENLFQTSIELKDSKCASGTSRINTTATMQSLNSLKLDSLQHGKIIRITKLHWHTAFDMYSAGEIGVFYVILRKISPAL